MFDYMIQNESYIPNLHFYHALFYFMILEILVSFHFKSCFMLYLAVFWRIWSWNRSNIMFMFIFSACA